jgi:hypothetical protein
MSRLHDLKTGIATKMVSATTSVVMKPLTGIALGLQKKLSKEDPKKVRAFLEDLAGDPELPPAVRQACQTLLDGIADGTPIKKVMQDTTKKNIEDLESKLRVSYDKS